MADVRATPISGEGDHRATRYHDEADGSFSEASASHLRGWDSTDGDWYRLLVDHATGALVVKATLAAGTVDVGIVDQGTAGSSAWKVTDSALTDGTARVGGTVAVTQSTSPWVTNDPGLPDTLGQKAMANSTGVVLASDQSSIPVAATLAAETTKVIGTVNQGTSPWVTSASVSNFPATQAVSNAGTFAVQDTTGMAADATGTLPAVIQIVGGYDGTNARVATIRAKDGVGMLHTSDQQVRNELEHIHVLLYEQNDILRQLLGERADLT